MSPYSLYSVIFETRAQWALYQKHYTIWGIQWHLGFTHWDVRLWIQQVSYKRPGSICEQNDPIILRIPLHIHYFRFMTSLLNHSFDSSTEILWNVIWIPASTRLGEKSLIRPLPALPSSQTCIQAPTSVWAVVMIQSSSLVPRPSGDWLWSHCYFWGLHTNVSKKETKNRVERDMKDPQWEREREGGRERVEGRRGRTERKRYISE